MKASIAYEVAETIMKQLGAGRFAAMTGVRGVTVTEKGVLFHVPNARCNGKKVSKVQIDLEPSDTYTVSVWRITKKAPYVEMVGRETEVYCDTLQESFTRLTGLYTSL